MSNGERVDVNELISELTAAELIEHVARQDNLTVLEVEMLLRLESYVNLYGDYLSGDAEWL